MFPIGSAITISIGRMTWISSMFYVHWLHHHCSHPSLPQTIPVNNCRNVAKPNCRQIADEQCREVPNRECGRVPVQQCRQVRAPRHPVW